MKIPVFSSLSEQIPSVQFGKVGFWLVTLLLGQWMLADVFHIPGGGISLVVGIYAIWTVFRPSTGGFESPSTVQGWIRRCREVLKQFEELEGDDSNLKVSSKERNKDLDEIINRSGLQKLAFVSSLGAELPEKTEIQSAIAISDSFSIFWTSPLELKEKSSVWPKYLFEKDLIIYVLSLPLKAADLLWLQEIPDDQPAWVFVSWNDAISWIDQLKALEAQLPHRLTSRVLRWTGDEKDLRDSLGPVREVLEKKNRNIDLTRQRSLSKLHSSWQADLEQLRRKKFLSIQKRNQWIVAGAVFASPVPSTDLLAVAVVNGLMMQEMAKIWSCSWGADSLRLVARHLAAVALAQGVVEWSGQALLGAAKLHGTTWLAAGTMQALSAAYLTRVVGRSMSDWMALNNGVLEPDLEDLKNKAPQLVANASKRERVDWAGFLQQASNWINETSSNSANFPLT